MEEYITGNVGTVLTPGWSHQLMPAELIHDPERSGGSADTVSGSGTYKCFDGSTAAVYHYKTSLPVDCHFPFTGDIGGNAAAGAKIVACRQWYAAL